MKKRIVVWLEGDLKELFRKWSIPAGVEFEQESEQESYLTFADENIPDFYHFEKIAKEIGLTMDSTFQAHSFDENDCKNAELLKIRLLCRNLLTVVEPFPIREMMNKLTTNDNILIVSNEPEPIQSQISFTCTNLLLFRTELVSELNKHGLGSSLYLVPATIKMEVDNTETEWFWVSSKSDLGPPIVEQRYLDTFNRTNWHGQHFAYSSFYGPRQLYISQVVYQFFEAMPYNKKGEIFFEPVELI